MRKTLLLSVITLAALASCKKENQDQQVDPVILENKVKTSTSNTGTATYKYDAEGRRTQVLFGDGSKREYEYLEGIVNEKAFNSAGVMTTIYKQELNSDGLAIKETISNEPGYTRTRQYNADKQMLNWTQVNNGSTLSADFFYSNGNCDSVRFTHNGNWTYTERNTYHTDKINVLGNDAFGTPHYGKSNKNLSKTNQNFWSNGTSSFLTTTSYEYDSKGRVIKANYLFNGNTTYSLYSY